MWHEKPRGWIVILAMALLPTVAAQRLDAQPLITWGDDYHGQVGDGTSAYTRPPQPYTQLNDVVAGDCGRTWCMALRANGTVQSWASNDYGALGRPGAGPLALPGEVPGLSNIVQVSAGTDHGLALADGGSVYGWGYNLYGQVGDGTQFNRPAPVPASAFPAGVRAIGTGSHHSVVLLPDSTVWTVGDNSLGQLGRPAGPWSATPGPVAGLDSVVAIAVALESNLALRADGTVWGWGLNGNGVLGNGTTTNSPTPVQVSGLNDVASIALGYYNGFAIKNDGSCWGWGANLTLGHGDAQGTSTTPQLISSLTGVLKIEAGDGGYSMALLSDGTLRVWGTNSTSNVFNDASRTQSAVPIPVPGITGVTAFEGGYQTVLALGSVTAVGVALDTAPVRLALAVRPNPVRGTTRIHFDVPFEGPVSLGVYDIAGRLVRSLVSESMGAGRHVISWRGGGSTSGPPAGVYFVRLRVGGQTLTRAVLRLE